MKNISVILFSIITSFSLMSQTFNKNYFDTDANDSFVSIYLSIDNLMISKSNSLVGNFISYYNDGDTLHISMSEKNGDVIFLNIFNHNNKMSVIITENMINGKTKVYFSDSCFLERKSRG
jgi:dimeric dUTPase (all-alpha-NTP-PPase superfamily)